MTLSDTAKSILRKALVDRVSAFHRSNFSEIVALHIAAGIVSGVTDVSALEIASRWMIKMFEDIRRLESVAAAVLLNDLGGMAGEW